jgi:hypothetical protein
MILEKTVQKRALKYLENYYQNKILRRKIFAAQEVRTKRVFGGKRADGLLVYRSRLSAKPFVVSMEAKSIKTLPSIQPYQDYRRWARNCLKVGFSLCLASGLLFAFLQDPERLNWKVPFAFSILSGLSFGLLSWNNYRHKTVAVISQLKQYPANEQWLAFSNDAFYSLAIEKQKLLKTICQFRGIGLLLIGKNTETELLSKPQKRWSWFFENRGGWQWISDYLIYYSREKEIRKVIK